MKKIIVALTIISLFFSLNSFTAQHEYYVSVTKVEYREEQQSLQIISQIFIDDFEKLLRERYDEKITLAEKNEPEIIETYMKKYLGYKLNIKIDTKEMNFNFIGKEYKDDIVYCYLEIKNIKAMKTLEIKNEVLFDIYPKQQNILRTKIYDRDKSFILIPENKTAVLNFD